MTIDVYGHVQSLDHAGAGHVLVRIQVEASRMPCRAQGHPPVMEIYASSDEVAEYRPGAQVHIQIRRNFPPTSEGGK